MGAAKRLYLYVVSALSLLALSVGLYNLVAAVLGGLADQFGATIISGGGGSGREQISLAIALVVVGAPIFAIHWSLVGRSWAGSDEAACDDRHSALRAFHMGLVATVALAFATFAALQSLDYAFGTILGVDQFGGPATGDLALLLVAVPVWWYHQQRRNLDIRHDRLTDGASWLTRFHRYAWAFVGLMLLVNGASQVLETIASVVIGRSGFGAEDDWWLGTLAWSVSTIIVGSGLFWFHGNDARQAIRDAAIIGEDDRVSALRAAYFGGVILVALAYVAVTVATSLAELGRWVLGAGETSGIPAFLELVVGPLLVAIPFAIAGWLHWAAQRREAAGRSPVALAGAERLGLHLTALVGIAFLAVGVAQLLGRLIEVALDAATVDDFFRYELAWFVAQVIIGAVLLVPAWMSIMRRRAADPSAERSATAGRAYLYLVVGAALLAAVPSAAFSLYRLIDTMLGGRGVALGSELAIPIAVVIVASIIAAYHGRLLVSDLRFAVKREPPVVAGATIESEAAAEPSRPAPATPVGASLALTLRGPTGADLESLASLLRERLPAGVTLEGR